LSPDKKPKPKPKRKADDLIDPLWRGTVRGFTLLGNFIPLLFALVLDGLLFLLLPLIDSIRQDPSIHFDAPELLRGILFLTQAALVIVTGLDSVMLFAKARNRGDS